jgi:glycosyltransferase involved in cell wall biosynthesis
MTGDIRVVGVSLVRDEDLVAPWAWNNVLDFCDRLIILDNGSADRTRAIAAELALRHSHVEVHDVPDAYDTHRFVEPLAGQPVWVMGVDGDEVYDRDGLARLKASLRAGRHDRWWSLVGHTLHVTRGDLAAGRAGGFVSPASRSITKLYNFRAIESWRQGRHERLHGKDMVFRPGWDRGMLYRFDQEMGWSESDFRCLHLCFMPRSSRETAGSRPRDNPVEARSRRKPFKSLERGARRLLGLPERRPNYKLTYYAVGDCETRTLSGFGRPADASAFDTQAAATDVRLAEAMRAP